MKNKMKKKPELNKKTVSSLNKQQLKQVFGGDDILDAATTIYIGAGGEANPIVHASTFIFEGYYHACYQGYIDSCCSDQP